MNTPSTPHIVLCVDDDMDDRELLYSTIKTINPQYEVIQAENGTQAYELLLKAKNNKNFPSLIILDINMPEMNGKEMVMEIKKDPELSAIPTVVYTTSSSAADKAFFSRYQVEMITKPATLKLIEDEVKYLLSLCSGAN